MSKKNEEAQSFELENNNNNENNNELENMFNLTDNDNNNNNDNDNEENEEEQNFENQNEEGEEEEDEEEENFDESEEEGEKLSFLDQIIETTEKKKNEINEEIILNIHFKTFTKSPQQQSLKKEENLMRFNINKLLQKKKIKYKITNEFNDSNFFIILSKEIPKDLSDIYNVVKKVNIEIEEGFIKNVIFVVLQEGDEKDKCEVFKSNLKELKVLKLYIKKGEDKDGRKTFLTCTNNRIQIDYIINSIQNFYELKIKELENIKLDEVNNENLELEEPEVDTSLDEELYSNSVIIFTNINETKKLTLKDPSKKIRLILSSFDKFMSNFPSKTNILCSKILNSFKDKNDFFIETNKAVYLDASINPIGSTDSELHQYITQVYNHYSLQNNGDWLIYEEKKENKLKNNVLKKYLIAKEYLDNKSDKLNKLFNFDIHYNQGYPTFVLEDIILPLIAKHNEKIKVLIPCFIKINILDNNNGENINKTKNNDSTLYLISYLYYSNQRIYLYPLYFNDTDKKPLDNSKKMEEIKKNILQNTNYYFTEIIKSSVLYSFVKIQFGGIINHSIESIDLNDLNFHQNHFFTVFFQLFYALMNLDKKPNEVLDIFAANDLIDHYYIFLQFVQEICDKGID